MNRAKSEVQVLFIDYGSVSWCNECDLRQNLFTLEIPVQCLTLQIQGILPVTQAEESSGWEKDTLDILHSFLVDQ